MRKSILVALRQWSDWFNGNEQTIPAGLRLDACVLEDRYLYSATAMPIDLAEAAACDSSFEITQSEIDSILECVNASLGDTQSPLLAHPGTATLYSSEIATASLDSAAVVDGQSATGTDASSDVASDMAASAAQTSDAVADARERFDVAFVDGSLDNLDDLLAQLRSSYEVAGGQLEIVLLDHDSSGIHQVTSYLETSGHEFSSIHLVTHGTDGGLQLGTDLLTTANLDDFSDQFAQWQLNLTDDADLLLYGCQVASTTDGQQFTQELSQLLSVDIAASEDWTGSTQRGGDWQLEYKLGQLETASLSAHASDQDQWDGLLAIYTVTNTGNTGAGSLAQAITDANNNAGADSIVFNISGTGVHTINLTSLLPTITGQVTINATTESDFAGTPLIVVNGGGTLSDGFLFGSGSSGSSIRGFVIQGFSNGISTSDTSNLTIAGNYIGTSSTGNAAATQTVSNGLNFWNTTNSIIGGTSILDRNVISGTTNIGINLTGSSTGNQIQGNYIGLGANGTTDLGNRWFGIYSSAANNTIGGSVSGAGNVISGTGTSGGGAVGISLTSTASGTTIQGNIIGLNATGTSAVANDGHGLNIASNNNTVGGSTALQRNIISGNNQSGIWVSGSNNIIQGNYVGTGSDGTTALGNSWDAVTIAGNNNLIGGTGAGQGNILANSGDDGVEVTTAGSGNALLGNVYYNNSSMAIDLGPNDSTPTINDIDDADTGSNGLQNHPILKSATTINGNTIITGKLLSTANTTFRVEFYTNPYGTAESTGYGEGRIYLGSASVTTDANGYASINTTLTGVTLETGSTVTSVATVDLGSGNYGSSSEFGGNIIANESNLMISGSYTGNAVDNRTIAGLGFRPEVIIVMSANGSVMRTSTMSGDVSKIAGSLSGLTSNIIQSFTGDGFTIGTSSLANSSGVTYHWVAFGAGDNFDVGSYSGNGTSKTISSVGFQSETAFVLSEGAQQLVVRTDQNTNTFDLTTGAAISTGVTGFSSTGFTVSSSATVNQSGSIYHYFSLDAAADYFKTGTYTGNGVDSRNITGVGFEPEFVITKATSTANFAIGKTESTGYNTDANVAGATNQLQALNSDGFQVGTDTAVNGSGTTYMYMAFAQHDPGVVVDTTSDTADSGATSLYALRASKGADGRISLREAIIAANGARNGVTADEIDFNISGAGVQTITVGTTGLNTITDAVKIDALTQPTYSSTPLIELNGNNTGTTKDGLVLGSGSSGSTIRGFIINRFTGDGIEINSSNNNVIEGNWIGLANTGTSASANAMRGIYAINSTGLMIGGTSSYSRNVIAGNTQQGIHFDNVDNSSIVGNYIGTNFSGTGDVNGSTGNTLQSGIVLLNGSSGNTIGGLTSAERNVISGNNHFGIEIQGLSSVNNNVQGNYIGTNAGGTSALGNTNGGLSFWGSGTGNVLGGSASGARNVIAGNTGNNVWVSSGSTSATIQGNYIGVGADGSTRLSTSVFGVYIDGGATNTLVGTNADGSNDANERNIISGNSDGIVVSGSTTTGTSIAGNYIGTDATGSFAAANSGDGIRVLAGAGSTTIGGTSRRNVISGNMGDGIQIDGETTDGVTITNNYIGVNAAGTGIIGNRGYGIYITNGADNTVIGGSSLGNVIGGNWLSGIAIDGATSGTLIYGNFIGTDSTGTYDFGNLQHGIMLANGATNNTIGNTTAGQSNTIANSGAGSGAYDGIFVTSTASTGNMILRNSIYSNSGLGIDLGAAGVTANDTLDGDTGANNLQNTPVLSTATTNGSTVTVSGSLNSLASMTGVLIQFYATPTGI